jgi:hypothetical protein
MIKRDKRPRGSTNLIVICVGVAVLCLLVIGGSAVYIVYTLGANPELASGPTTTELPPGFGQGPGGPPGSPQNPGPQIGQNAPEIDGEDVDGVKFKLSDYRGKVVVLDFWGHW